jgi:hypothetical protein
MIEPSHLGLGAELSLFSYLGDGPVDGSGQWIMWQSRYASVAKLPLRVCFNLNKNFSQIVKDEIITQIF